MTAASMSKVGSTYDEASMHQSMLFSDSLKDLKNLRTQLYSAAEYFELSYTNDDQKQIVVETLKDYAIKAIVNTVDHLGSVSYKVNDLLDEKVDEVYGTELRVSCIEQRLRTCQSYIGREGIRQQTLLINTPKHHKRYVLPVGEKMSKASQTQSAYCDDKDGSHHYSNSVRPKIKETAKDVASYGEISNRSSNFLFTSNGSRKEPEVSQHFFPASRTGSGVAAKPSGRSTTPNSRGNQLEQRKSVSMRLPAEKNGSKEFERQPSRSKRLLKALLSRRQTKKDDTLYTYLDEY